MMIDNLLIAGAIIGAVVLIGCLAGLYFYDPEIEIIPGRSVPRSLAKKLDAVEGIDANGNWSKWVNPKDK